MSSTPNQQQHDDDVELNETGNAAATAGEEEEAVPNVINIRFATGQSLTIPYPASPCTVYQFKQLIRQRVDELAHNVETCEKFELLNKELNPATTSSSSSTSAKYLRLIYHGRLLVDAHDLSHVKILRGAACHCTLAERASPMESMGMVYPNSAPNNSNNNNTSSTAASLNSSSNLNSNSQRQNQQQQQHQAEDPASSNNNNNNNGDAENEENDDDRPRGFDRLRESGFAQEDINFIRNQFYSTRQHLLAQVQSRAISQRQLHEMEEQWMSEDFTNHAHSQETEVIDIYNNSIHAGTHGGSSASATNGGLWSDDHLEDEFVTSSDGSNYHMFFGTLMGFLFGIIMLITVRSSEALFGIILNQPLTYCFVLLVNSFSILLLLVLCTVCASQVQVWSADGHWL